MVLAGFRPLFNGGLEVRPVHIHGLLPGARMCRACGGVVRGVSSMHNLFEQKSDTPMFRYAKSALAALVLMASPAAAEVELSFYLGWQATADSTGSGTLPGGAAFSRRFDWDARPFDSPIYYGGRAIYWTQSNWGFGVEGTHTKAYASPLDLAALGLSRLELSDGHNIITANAMKRFPVPSAIPGSRPIWARALVWPSRMWTFK